MLESELDEERLSIFSSFLYIKSVDKNKESVITAILVQIFLTNMIVICLSDISPICRISILTFEKSFCFIFFII